MSAGHTDRATINARRPLTPGMRGILAFVTKNPGVTRASFVSSERSSLRALVDRKYLRLDENGGYFTVEEPRP